MQHGNNKCFSLSPTLPNAPEITRKSLSENSGFTTKDGARKRLEERRRAVSTGEHSEFQRYKDVTLHQVAEDLKAQYRTKGRRSTGKLNLSLDRLEKHFGATFPIYALTAPGFHDLRRTFAREADRCGVPHSEIMRIAGWKTYAMLLRYLGTNEDRMRSAFATMDATFGKVKEQSKS